MHFPSGIRCPLLRLVKWGLFPAHRGQWGGLYFGFGVPLEVPRQVMPTPNGPFRPPECGMVLRTAQTQDQGRQRETGESWGLLLL